MIDLHSMCLDPEFHEIVWDYCLERDVIAPQSGLDAPLYLIMYASSKYSASNGTNYTKNDAGRWNVNISLSGGTRNPSSMLGEDLFGFCNSRSGCEDLVCWYNKSKHNA